MTLVLVEKRFLLKELACRDSKPTTFTDYMTAMKEKPVGFQEYLCCSVHIRKADET